MECIESVANHLYHGTRGDLLTLRKTSHSLLDTTCQEVGSNVSIYRGQNTFEEPVATGAILLNGRQLAANYMMSASDDGLPSSLLRFLYQFRRRYPIAK